MRGPGSSSTVKGLLLIVVLAFHAIPAAAAWQDQLPALLAAEDASAQETLLAEILSAEPSCAELRAAITTIDFPPPPVRSATALDSIRCADGVLRPFVTYVPSGYDPQRPTPLLLRLHGGVGRATLVSDAPGYAAEDEFLPLAEERGWLLLYPFGQAGATWWDETGMAMISELIRVTKRAFNVDDDRVWMTGFSDGASGAYGFAMLRPTDFAAFVPLNGHMGVAASAGEQDTYAPNLAATPIFAVNTDEDGLYPARKARPMIDMAREAGGDILYREFHGYGHNFDYAPLALPAIAGWLERHARDPFPRDLGWETSLPKNGLCRWFRVDRVLPEPPGPWHRDWNVELVNDRVSIGFHADDEHEGNGVRVSRLADGDYLATRIGLAPGDVIVGGNSGEIADMAGLGAFKAGLSRGDEAELTVLRAGEELRLRGRLPDVENHFLFPRKRPSAAMRVSLRDDTVRVLASRLGGFTLLLHPELLPLEREIVVEVNGRTVFRGVVEPDPGFLLRQFLAHRDRRLLYSAKLSIDLRE